MRFDTTALTLAALVAPALAAQTWDVNIVNGQFQPQILDIAVGDTVRWPLNDGADHAIVETVDGARSCVSKVPGGFNSGRKTSGQAYFQHFREPGVVNYKDGIGANCLNGATGTIYVGARPDNATDPTGPVTTSVATTSSATGTATATDSSSGTATATTTSTLTRSTTATTTTTRIISTFTMTPTPTPTETPSAANGLLAHGSLIMGIAGVIGALVAL
ncbi:hypothetical protein B0O80DRAFT_429073 [Mortierella sp. GBAus27b]|nr:hypothetical protein BGX31_003135 [Mortierella sp. GBA43]KAI8349280.1 hypothetical protein B0O80DRAFT_429073 [Mortierella sp. GBAus27b]